MGPAPRREGPDRVALTAGYQGSYSPRLEFSPSAMALAARCWRAWVLRYLYGIKSEVPTKGKIVGTVTHGHVFGHVLGKTVYNPIFGPKEHGDMQLYAERGGRDGGPGDLREVFELAPKLALEALPYLPDVHAPGIQAQIEVACNVDLSRYRPGTRWRFSPRSSRDIRVELLRVALYLYDLKTTKGRQIRGTGLDPWAYALTAEELAGDIQWLQYALTTLDEAIGMGLRQDLQTGRWIYMCTQGTPQGMAVDVVADLPELLLRLQPWFELGDRMAEAVERCWQYGPPPLDSLPEPAILTPDEDSPCAAFGIPGECNCEYHEAKGGPCAPGGGVMGHLIRVESLLVKHRPETFTSEAHNMSAFTAPGFPATPTPATFGAPTLPVGAPGGAVAQPTLGSRVEDTPGANPFRAPEIQHVIAAQANAPAVMHNEVNGRAVRGVPGSVATYLDTGAYLVGTDGRQYDVQLQPVPAPAQFASGGGVAAGVTVSGTFGPAAEMAAAAQAAAGPAAAAGYVPPPQQAEAPKAKPKGKPRRVAGDTDATYAAKVAAWEAGRAGGVPTTPPTSPVVSPPQTAFAVGFSAGVAAAADVVASTQAAPADAVPEIPLASLIAQFKAAAEAIRAYGYPVVAEVVL
jgi:hypothetical protein